MSKRHEERLKESDALLRAKEKQLRNLLEAFKRQMELIHVLKQQKVFIIQCPIQIPGGRLSFLQLHLEASHVLKYSEKEFMDTLDWKPFSQAAAADK